MRISDWSSDVCSSDLGISLPAVVWPLVQHRLAVEADHPHGVPRDAVLIEKTHHSIGLRQCQRLFRLCEYPGFGSVEAPCESRIECLRYPLLQRVGIKIGRASCWERVCQDG